VGVRWERLIRSGETAPQPGVQPAHQGKPPQNSSGGALKKRRRASKPACANQLAPFPIYRRAHSRRRSEADTEVRPLGTPRQRGLQGALQIAERLA